MSGSTLEATPRIRHNIDYSHQLTNNIQYISCSLLFHDVLDILVPILTELWKDLKLFKMLGLKKAQVNKLVSGSKLQNTYIDVRLKKLRRHTLFRTLPTIYIF